MELVFNLDCFCPIIRVDVTHLSLVFIHIVPVALVSHLITECFMNSNREFVNH
jgi:hypothetical protein